LPQNQPERAAYLVSGAAVLEGEPLAPMQMRVVDAGAPAVLQARDRSVIMLLGGQAVGPRFIEWNFVGSSRERIEAAKADWRAGRMKLPDADHAEFIPLPPDPPPAAGGLS
jgi:redox-sensitive bicupin YhaK (pirin superfamily)